MNRKIKAKVLIDIETDFDNFLDGIEYCDWEGQEIECQKCGNKFQIDCIDWD